MGRVITSCFYPNSKCEGDEDEFGVSCTHTEANECPNQQSEGSMVLDECVKITGGGSRMVTCPGPWWPWLAAFIFICAVVAAIVHYWKKVQASARMEEYLDSLPWYHSAKPHVHSAEVKIAKAAKYVAKGVVAAEHAVADRIHGHEPEPEPQSELAPLDPPPAPPDAPTPAATDTPPTVESQRDITPPRDPTTESQGGSK